MDKDVSRHTLVEGESTRLRPASWGFSEGELLRRYRWSQDDELQFWSGSIPGGRSYTNFVETVALRDWPPDGRRVSYAILTHDNELIGMVSCYNIDRDRSGRGVGEIGIYLGEKQFWGHGYGTDALTAFLRHLFDDLQFASVYLHTYENNHRARRSYASIGFVLEETRRRYSTRVGYHDEVRMSITARQYDALHPRRNVLTAP